MFFRALVLVALVLAPLAGAQTAYRLLQADYQGRQIGSKHYSADGVSYSALQLTMSVFETSSRSDGA
jgi:hypothetical protein